MDAVHVPLNACVLRSAWGRIAGAVAGLGLLAGCASGTSTGGNGSGPSTPAAPTTSRPASAVSTTSRTATTPHSTPPPSAPAGNLAAFHVTDLTFVGTQDGWALGTVACRTGGGRCPALARTTDGARTWQALPTPPGDVADAEQWSPRCDAPCLDHVRFATDEIGYLFGDGMWTADDRSALYLTTDGGRTWSRQPGGAVSLETLSGTVIRLVDQGGCPPGCTYRVEVAPVGGTAWRAVHLPGSPGSGGPATLVRTEHIAGIEDFGNPAGGADAHGVLWTSADDGASWTNRGEPCPQDEGVTPRPGIRTSEVDSAALAAAPDGSLTVLCVPRFRGHSFTITSTDGGSSFHAANRAALGRNGGLVGAASATDLFVEEDALYRSTDGGRTWARVQDNGNRGPLRADWIGFETTRVGRVVERPATAARTSADLVWTTTDGGATWRPGRLTVRATPPNTFHSTRFARSVSLCGLQVHPVVRGRTGSD